MTTSNHWLLIGGPAHGQTLHSGETRTLRFEQDGIAYQYAGSRYELNGATYRVGVCDTGVPVDGSGVAIGRLILATKLEPLPS